MNIGVPKEIKSEEFRVSLTPDGVKALVAAGHGVAVQKGAGAGAGFGDGKYERAGAALVDQATAWQADLVVKVKEPLAAEFDFLRPGLILFTYLHLAAAQPLAERLLDRQVSGIAYETMENADGTLPLLRPMSEIAGRLAVQAGARFLEKSQGGSGVLLSGATGAPRGKVAILGIGVAGAAALKIAVGMGAEVVVLNRSAKRLARYEDLYMGRITALISTPESVARAVAESDLVIGAVLVSGDRAPVVVSDQMVASMRPGSVLVDISIDQGGCIATSHPTTHADPVFVVHDVIHYCVANMPSAVARTSTMALTSVTLPYLLKLASHGLKAAAADPALALGVNTHLGQVRHPAVAQALGRPYKAFSA